MFKKLTEQIQHFFGISRKEARGAIALMVICVLIVWFPFVFRRYILPLFPPGPAPLSQAKLDSIVADIEVENKARYKAQKRKPPEYFKKPAKPVRLFAFDPNAATVEQLSELGIPLFLARRIDKFRSKGGKFRKKEDLLHIYDFPPELFQKLTPFIEIQTGSPVGTRLSKAPEAVNTPKEGTRKFAPPAISPFDINTADTTELVKLRGIGTKLSVRILKFRDGLGGFHSKSQFAEVFGLDSIALGELNKYAVISTGVKKININTATAAELGSHSYLKNKKLVSVIINYRNQHGSFKNSADLRNVKILDEEQLRKIEPYLDY
ncbi:ComEA family DNA-binding protein [Dyadobacter crusticola]|uniref:ComEA family DNA-binding protein n=1 Tax=Dyadobacter crusticola TaxID=292407 RepID=UPI0004E286CA|nr:helix-hairpin-helix domain-containing protein [Dyadobacter crusticola]